MIFAIPAALVAGIALGFSYHGFNSNKERISKLELELKNTKEKNKQALKEKEQQFHNQLSLIEKRYEINIKLAGHEVLQKQQIEYQKYNQTVEFLFQRFMVLGLEQISTQSILLKADSNILCAMQYDHLLKAHNWAKELNLTESLKITQLQLEMMKINVDMSLVKELQSFDAEGTSFDIPSTIELIKEDNIEEINMLGVEAPE